jgi:FixJ family two-component response regulator
MSQARQTIAIVDDDASVRKALRRLLRSAGWHVEVFGSAEEFLQAADQPEAGCLILDVHLPGMCGLELQARLQAAGRCVPVVFITAYGDEQTRAQALRAGALAFLEKPFEEQVLLEAVGRALG